MPTTLSYNTTTDNVDWTQLVEDLKTDAFDNGRTPDELAASFHNSGVVAFARKDERIVGKARALTDGVCNAYVVDVWTSSRYRRLGIATQLMRLLEAQLAGQHIFLFTDDAKTFYNAIGYSDRGRGFEKVAGTWLNRKSAT